MYLSDLIHTPSARNEVKSTSDDATDSSKLPDPVDKKVVYMNF